MKNHKHYWHLVSTYRGTGDTVEKEYRCRCGRGKSVEFWGARGNKKSANVNIDMVKRGKK